MTGAEKCLSYWWIMDTITTLKSILSFHVDNTAIYASSGLSSYIADCWPNETRIQLTQRSCETTGKQ